MRHEMEPHHVDVVVLVATARRTGRRVRRLRRVLAATLTVGAGVVAAMVYGAAGLGSGGDRVSVASDGAPSSERLGGLTVEQAFREAAAVAVPQDTVTRLSPPARWRGADRAASPVSRSLMSVATSRGAASAVEVVYRVGSAGPPSRCRRPVCRRISLRDGATVWTVPVPDRRRPGVGLLAWRDVTDGVVALRAHSAADRSGRLLDSTPVLSERSVRELLSLPLWEHLRTG
jgi:hypothetical protein